LDKLLKSLGNLNSESLQEVSDRALALIVEKDDGEKQSFIDSVVRSTVGIGTSIAALFDQHLLRKSRSRGSHGLLRVAKWSDNV